jgi:hypothetical protein
MGLERRPKSGRKFDGSKIIVDNNGVKTFIVNQKEPVPPIYDENGTLLERH